MKILETVGELIGAALAAICTVTGILAFISFCLWVIKITNWGM